MANELFEEITQGEYKYGFVTNIEADNAPKGLNEDIVRFISKKKNEPEFMLEYRLKAFRYWQKMKEPTWAHIHYPEIDFQNIIYYSAIQSGNIRHPIPACTCHVGRHCKICPGI